MRPQQNRRMRGRNNNNNNNNNNNRRGPNPLSRNYESNGPDVKIRGNAQHIADKYTTLARDAQASGDRVMAENYLQHAEHYMRIILAAQAQMPQPIQRDDVSDDDIDENNVGDVVDNGDASNDMDEPAGSGPQPDIEGIPAEVALSESAQPKADDSQEKRPRRVQRRRMPRQVETIEDTGLETNADEAPVDNDTAPQEEVKPRRRRTTKPKIDAEA